METSVILDSMYNMKSQIKIFETGIEDGIMSRNKKFYEEGLSQNEINTYFYKTRQKIGEKYGFKGEKVFQANQKTNNNNVNYTDGKYIVINEEYLKKEDYWEENLEADILIISNKYKNVVIGNQMADCPIVIIEDRKLGVTALAHCGVSYIDRQLPKQIVEALEKEYNSNPENLYAYIGSCAKKESYIYDKYPTWATNESVWKNYIVKKDNKYYIDTEGAIIKQLEEKGLKNITISPHDTVKSDKYYSHSASYNGNKNKFGQNFVGFFYE